ncbi:hypothetical protein DCAR_0522142 [Daucus carota subsp. sativus]|uniref:Heptahelical transmembrane protein 4-like n=3 Tax=Daucus carota subsp. sativus TaxID=79200 RepID=A0AAF1B307_DAUCS|nr:PREDICTED: heptahelical transmembrane protein 4-like isoform X1 [Daucus carota subsp. sativus]XP_017248845.1 PREDICTED: heptahelical transmembrane protein 4-like isoform X1 [Daucus carota subsp. sativus]WOH02753.1 hypothetical protein DCAR_0522142 [Daucus carota subsp. sativus]
MVDDQKEKCIVLSETSESQMDCESGSRLFSKEGKSKKFWRGVKYQLVEYHTLPAYLKDNEYILRYYRSEWPLKQVFLSIFYIHNETLNIWTHLIGFLLFLSLTIYTAMKIPKVMDLQVVQQLSNMLRSTDLSKINGELLNLPSLPNMADFHRFKNDLKTSLPSVDFLPSLSGWNGLELIANCLPKQSTEYPAKDCILKSVEGNMGNSAHSLPNEPVTRWPFFTFLGGAMFCLLASSTCHLLSCYSERLSYIMLRLDYSGIAALIATSFYPPVYYSFMCHPFLCDLYLTFITLLGLASIAFSLLPVFQKPHFRTLRASLFFGMGVSGAVPIMHKLILYWDKPVALETTGYEVLMGAFYGIGALIYAKRIPECWKPGKYDIAGHSHQLFHVLVVAGAYTHYHAGLIYLRWRDLEGCSKN